MQRQDHRSTPCCFVDACVQPEDITCVHAALGSVDPETLLCVLLETRLSWKADPRLITGAAKRHLLKKTSAMLGLMHDLEPALVDDPDKVIIPVQSFECAGDGMGFNRRVSAALLDLPKCADGEGVLDYALSLSHFRQNAKEDGFPWTDALASADSLIGAPWTEVLGRALWTPSSLSEYERTSQLAHLFWVMGFSGFAEAVHEMRTVNLRRYPDVAGISEECAFCFQENERKMAAIVALMNHNSLVDAQRAAKSLKRTLVA